MEGLDKSFSLTGRFDLLNSIEIFNETGNRIELVEMSACDFQAAGLIFGR